MRSRGGGGGVGQEKVDRRPPTDRLQTPGSVGPCSSFKFKFKVGAAAAIAARLHKLQLQDRRAAALAAAVGTRTDFAHFWSCFLFLVDTEIWLFLSTIDLPTLALDFVAGQFLSF